MGQAGKPGRRIILSVSALWRGNGVRCSGTLRQSIVVGPNCCTLLGRPRPHAQRMWWQVSASTNTLGKHFAGSSTSSVQLAALARRPVFVVSPLLQQVERCSHTAMRLFSLYALTTCALAAPRGRGGTPTKPSTSERQRRLYDRGCLFSPEGRVYQVEYAEKNVARGSFAVEPWRPTASRSPPCARRTRGPCPARSWRGGGASACTASTTRSRASPAAWCRTRCSSSRPCATSAGGTAARGRGAARRGVRAAPRPARARGDGARGGAALRRGVPHRRLRRGSSEPRLFRTEPSGAYEAYGGAASRRRAPRPTGRPSRTWSAPRRLLATPPTARTRRTRRPSRPRRRRRRRTGATPSRRTSSSPCCGPRAA